MKKYLLFLLLIIFCFSLVACQTGIFPLPESTASNGQVPAQGEECPQPEAGQEPLIDAARGVCFNYPAGYGVYESQDGSLTLYQQSLLNTEAPLAAIQISAAGDRTLDEISAEILADFALPAGAVRSATMGGQPAVVLDNLPGQDTSRRVLAIAGDYLYDVSVSRIGADYGAVGEEAEKLLDTITGSLTFIDIKPGAPLRAGVECPQPTSGTRLHKDNEAGYCLLLPEAYKADERTDADQGVVETAFYVGSPQAVDHARLFISVAGADGRTLEAVTLLKEEEIKTAVPDYNVPWSFGYMLDGVPANQFEQVPGQDLNRQVFFVRDDQLYTLTFIPDDPAAGVPYEEMAALYDLVMESFSFLWK